MTGRRAGVSVRIAGVVAAIAVLGVVGVMVSRSAEAQDRRSSRDRTADQVAAQIMTFAIETTASGELEARNQIEIRSKLEQQTTIVEVVAEGVMVQDGVAAVLLPEGRGPGLFRQDRPGVVGGVQKAVGDGQRGQRPVDLRVVPDLA